MLLLLSAALPVYLFICSINETVLKKKTAACARLLKNSKPSTVRDLTTPSASHLTKDLGMAPCPFCLQMVIHPVLIQRIFFLLIFHPLLPNSPIMERPPLLHTL